MGRKPNPETIHYYVNPKELTKEIKKYQETGEISEELGKMILKIAQRMAVRRNFSGYTYKEDFIGDAVLMMIRKLHRIDLNHPKCNVFAFLSQITMNAFINRIKKEKRIQSTKESYRDKMFSEFEDLEKIDKSNGGSKKNHVSLDDLFHEN